MMLEIAVWLSRLTVVGYVATLLMIIWIISADHRLSYDGGYWLIVAYVAFVLLNRFAVWLRVQYWRNR